MKTAVIGEDPDGLVVYNRALLDLARHYGYQPRACKPYRAKTKGKVERPFRYIREDFFLGGAFRNLDDLNAQLRTWLDTVANPRVHATTKRVVDEAFAEGKASLQSLPPTPYQAVLRLERHASHEGMVSVGGNLYSVPDTTRPRVLDVHVFADAIRIFEDGKLIAAHAPLEGRGQKRLDPAHRKMSSHVPRRRPPDASPPLVLRAGDHAARRLLAFYVWRDNLREKAYVFVAVEHANSEVIGIHAAKSANRFEALEPVRQGVKRCFGTIAPETSRGLRLRHDHGSN
jgi:hypothetical protein